MRCFATIYDPCRAKAFKWGWSDKGRLIRLGAHMCDLISRSTLVNAKRRYRMKKAINRMRIKIKNLVDDLHKKLSLWLSQHYDTVLVPTFNAHEMCGRNTRRIDVQTVKSMMTWAHGRFRQRLQYKMVPVFTTEQWTSKVCSECGFVKHNIGRREVFRCDQCAAVIDRDVNGAKNVLLKWMIDERYRASIRHHTN